MRPDDAFRAASVTKSVTAAVAVRLAGDGRMALDAPLTDRLVPELLHRWSALDALARASPYPDLPMSGRQSGPPAAVADYGSHVGAAVGRR